MTQRPRSLAPAITAVMAAAIAIPASSAPVVKRAPTTISPVLLQQRLTPILVAQKKEAETSAQQLSTEAKRAFDALAPERQLLNKALNADPRYRTYLAQVEAISKGGGTPQDKITRLKALSDANRPVLESALRVARVDRATIQAKSGRALVGTDLAMRFKPASSGSVGVLNTAPPPAPTDVVYDTPFDFEEVDTDNQGLAFQVADGSANADTGKANTNVMMVGLVGVAHASAAVGKTFEVPAGFKRAEVIVSIKGSYELSAASAVLAGGACGTYSVRITNLESGRSPASKVEDECVIAPIAWYAGADSEKNGDYTFRFDVPDRQREFLVTATAYSSALVDGLPAYGESKARVEIKKIRVKFLKD